MKWPQLWSISWSEIRPFSKLSIIRVELINTVCIGMISPMMISLIFSKKWPKLYNHVLCKTVWQKSMINVVLWIWYMLLPSMLQGILFCWTKSALLSIILTRKTCERSGIAHNVCGKYANETTTNYHCIMDIVISSTNVLWSLSMSTKVSKHQKLSNVNQLC